MYSIENVSLNHPLLLVGKEGKLIKSGLNIIEVIKQTVGSKYNIGDKLLVLNTNIAPLEIDGETVENTFYINEDSVKGVYDSVVN